PEFTGVSAWLGSPPLTMAELRGRVVLIDFWTHTCSNWQRTVPYLNRWRDAYRDKGLVIVRVHTPELSFQHERAGVEDANCTVRPRSSGRPGQRLRDLAGVAEPVLAGAYAGR